MGEEHQVRPGEPHRRPSRRATASLNLRLARPLEAAIRLFWNTPLGPPGPSAQSLELKTGGTELRAGREELADGTRLFRHFRGTLEPADLAGTTLLDVGCGYGGRTIYYEQECGAAAVTGIEPYESMVDRCRLLAAEVGSRAKFVVAPAERLPFPDASFDAVVSFDVLEHCGDPRRALAEIARVLRPDGRTWNVFPTYKGARSHHLGYVTSLPALHRVFHPDVLVEVVNRAIARAPERVGIRPQPPPAWSALEHYTLPTLNGLTLGEARTIFATTPGLRCEELIVTPLVDPQLTRAELEAAAGSRLLALPAFALGRLLAAWERVLPLPELFVQNIAVRAVRE